MSQKEPPKPRGRPPILEPEEVAVPGSIRLTRSRWAKLRRLGTAWLNRALDRAKDPQ